MISAIAVDIRDLIGAPFQPGGRGPAYDCWGLVREVLRRMELPAPEYEYQPEEVMSPERMHTLIQAARECDLPPASCGRWVPIGPEIGAVLAIKNAPGPFVNHCGIIVGEGVFFHTLQGRGAHLAALDSPVYRHRIRGFYRWMPSR